MVFFSKGLWPLASAPTSSREREREREELVTFLGRIPGQMWEYANTSVTYDAYGPRTGDNKSTGTGDVHFVSFFARDGGPRTGDNETTGTGDVHFVSFFARDGGPRRRQQQKGPIWTSSFRLRLPQEK